MQPKLSRLQKSILIFLYEGPVNLRWLICNLQQNPTRSFENTVYNTLNSLEKRWLLFCERNQEYRKTIELTKEGVDNAREILIIDGKCVRFSLKNSHLKTMLKKLSVNNTFKETVVLIRDNQFISVQRNPYGNFLRFFQANPGFFKDISGNGLFVFPIKEVKRVLTELSQDEVIEFEMRGNNLKIFTPTIPLDDIPCKDPDDIFRFLPFDWQSDILFYKNLSSSLGVHIEIKPPLLEGVFKHLRMLDSGIITISMVDSKVTFHLGSFNHIDLYPPVKVIKGNDFCVTLNKGSKHFKNVFDNDVLIKTDSDMPTIFSEKTNDYEFGLLVPLYTPYKQVETITN